jgi:hypothetical protein
VSRLQQLWQLLLAFCFASPCFGTQPTVPLRVGLHGAGRCQQAYLQWGPVCCYGSVVPLCEGACSTAALHCTLLGCRLEVVHVAAKLEGKPGMCCIRVCTAESQIGLCLACTASLLAKHMSESPRVRCRVTCHSHRLMAVLALQAQCSSNGGLHTVTCELNILEGRTSHGTQYAQR